MTATPELLAVAERRMSALSAAHPELADCLALERTVLQESVSAPRPPRITPFPLPREHLLARLDAGVPLLHDQPIDLDIHFAADLFVRLVGALHGEVEASERSAIEPHDPIVEEAQQHGPSTPTHSPPSNTCALAEVLVAASQAGHLDRVLEAVISGAIDPQQLFAEAFVQHAGHVAELAQRAGVDADLLVALAYRSVAPVRQAYAARLQPLLQHTRPSEPRWRRGYCPICGAWPLLAEQRDGEMGRCAGCGVAWQLPRRACAYCGNDDERTLRTLAADDERTLRTLAADDERTLRTLAAEGEPSAHVVACDDCHGYLKVIPTREEPTPAELLDLDDAATRSLDSRAVEHGYRRPAATGSAIELAVADDEFSDELF